MRGTNLPTPDQILERLIELTRSQIHRDYKTLKDHATTTRESLQILQLEVPRNMS